MYVTFYLTREFYKNSKKNHFFLTTKKKPTAIIVIKLSLKYSQISEANNCIIEPNLKVSPFV